MKRNILHTKTIFLAIILFAGILDGCTERELSERPSDGPLKIHIEWPENAEVKGAHLLLYRSNGTLHANIECGTEGHECRVPEDTYTILVSNSDYSNAECTNHKSLHECCICAKAHPTEEGVLQHVKNVYCIGENGIKINAGNQVSEVTLYPRNRVKYLHFDINPAYVDDIQQMQLRMTGVIPSVLLIDGSDTQADTQHILADVSTAGNGHYAADMSVFGWRGQNLVTVEITYTDNRQEVSLPQDIGQQLAALSEEGGTINITLELPSGGDILLNVTVNSWENGTGSGIVI